MKGQVKRATQTDQSGPGVKGQHGLDPSLVSFLFEHRDHCVLYVYLLPDCTSARETLNTFCSAERWAITGHRITNGML